MDKSIVKISVLMPVYNGELYLREAINSILIQTFTNFEFIIINDGSIDASENIIKEYIDPRIRYVKNDINKGLIYTLNKGLTLAKGSYIARMDADDISKPDRLAQQFSFMEQNPNVTLLGTAFIYMGTPYIINHPTTNDEIRIKLFRNTTFAHPSVMIRKSDIITYKLLYKDQYVSAEDYKLWTDIAMSGLKMVNLKDVLLEYRQHETQISTLKRIEQETTSNIIRKEYIYNFFGDNLKEQEVSIFANSFIGTPLFRTLSLAIKLSRLNKKQIFDKVQFDLFLRELMYNSSGKASLLDFLKIFKYLRKPLFVATFFNAYRKKINMNDPIVSIIVPCYNQAQYLPETLQSILDQNIENWECIIVNDGSPDNTEEIATEWSRNDDRFKYFFKKNGGLSDSRNFGIKNSKGKYILPLDSDDKISTSYLSEAIPILESDDNVKIVYSQAMLFGVDHGEWHLLPYSYDNMLFSRNCIHCAGVYRRIDYDKTFGYNSNMKKGWEDYDFWLSLLSEKDKVVKLNEFHFFYRTKNISMSTAITKEVESELRLQIFRNHLDVYLQYLNPLEINRELKRLKNIEQSKQYKIGRFLSTPISYFRNLFKK